jgi:hypothetical protein
LPYTRFCNCLLDYDYDLHIVNFAILYRKQETIKSIVLTNLSDLRLMENCKIMEHVVRAYNILYLLQDGFRCRQSCETQLFKFVDDITTNMRKGK